MLECCSPVLFSAGDQSTAKSTAPAGVAAWSATSGDPQDWERMIWSWIKNHDPASTPPIWLGYGDSDILTADGPPLLATVLPSERVFTVPGNHTAATFKAIFLCHLDTLACQ
jgi:hypothetical protein